MTTLWDEKWDAVSTENDTDGDDLRSLSTMDTSTFRRLRELRRGHGGSSSTKGSEACRVRETWRSGRGHPEIDEDDDDTTEVDDRTIVSQSSARLSSVPPQDRRNSSKSKIAKRGAKRGVRHSGNISSKIIIKIILLFVLGSILIIKLGVLEVKLEQEYWKGLRGAGQEQYATESGKDSYEKGYSAWLKENDGGTNAMYSKALVVEPVDNRDTAENYFKEAVENLQNGLLPRRMPLESQLNERLEQDIDDQVYASRHIQAAFGSQDLQQQQVNPQQSGLLNNPEHDQDRLDPDGVQDRQMNSDTQEMQQQQQQQQQKEGQQEGFLEQKDIKEEGHLKQDLEDGTPNMRIDIDSQDSHQQHSQENPQMQAVQQSQLQNQENLTQLLNSYSSQHLQTNEDTTDSHEQHQQHDMFQSLEQLKKQIFDNDIPENVQESLELPEFEQHSEQKHIDDGIHTEKESNGLVAQQQQLQQSSSEHQMQEAMDMSKSERKHDLQQPLNLHTNDESQVNLDAQNYQEQEPQSNMPEITNQSSIEQQQQQQQQEQQNQDHNMDSSKEELLDTKINVSQNELPHHMLKTMGHVELEKQQKQNLTTDVPYEVLLKTAIKDSQKLQIQHDMMDAINETPVDLDVQDTLQQQSYPMPLKKSKAHDS